MGHMGFGLTPSTDVQRSTSFYENGFKKNEEFQQRNVVDGLWDDQFWYYVFVDILTFMELYPRGNYWMRIQPVGSIHFLQFMKSGEALTVGESAKAKEDTWLY